MTSLHLSILPQKKEIKVIKLNKYVYVRFLCPRHEVAEGHIEFTLCVSAFVCVFQNRVRAITKPYMMGFENNLAQMIIMTRQCVACKNHLARLKGQGHSLHLNFVHRLQ